MRFRAEHLFTRSLPADRPRARAERPAGSLGFPGGRHLQGESSPRLRPHPSPARALPARAPRFLWAGSSEPASKVGRAEPSGSEGCRKVDPHFVALGRAFLAMRAPAGRCRCEARARQVGEPRHSAGSLLGRSTVICSQKWLKSLLPSDRADR